jgi:hypothetical protein
MSFRLAIATTTYKRPELTAAVVDWWSNLPFDEFGMTGVCVGDMENGFTWSDEGPALNLWQYCKEPINGFKALGQKHNMSVSLAAAGGADAVMVINSDTIVQPRLIENTVKELQAGALWTQPRELYFWHPATGRVAKAHHDNVTGAARAYSRTLLDKMNWKLWDDDAEHKLDGNALKNIENLVRSTRTVFGDASKGHYHMLGARSVEGAVLDIKTDVNMWPYDDAVAITRAHEVDPSILETFEIDRLQYHPHGRLDPA